MFRPIHFEIHCDDIARAKKFYETLFGWKIDKWGEIEYWTVDTDPEKKGAPGISGGLMQRKGPSPIDGQCLISPVNTMDVPNVDEWIQKALDNGGILVIPKMPIKGLGWLCYMKDTEGNIFGMMHSDPSAPADPQLRCQSCAMPIQEGYFGTNEDGSENREYCKFCFQNGSFIEPNLTLEEMIQNSVKYMTEHMKYDEQEAEKLSRAHIPNLKRWKK
jgi:predicted enzyme related to lactoylglutathione lyase